MYLLVLDKKIVQEEAHSVMQSMSLPIQTTYITVLNSVYKPVFNAGVT